MDFLQKFNNQIEERDKILRLVQYTTRLVWSLKEGPNENLKNIENAISLSRQMLRFGKCVEAINSSLNSMQLQDSFLRTALSLSRISNGLYVLCDNVVWLSKIGFIQIDEDRFSKLANSYWFYSTLLLLTKNVYQMQLIFQNHPRSFPREPYSKSNSEIAPSVRQLINFACYNKSLTLEILKNLCDICISLNASNKVALSPTSIGFAGVVSSVIPMLKYRTIYY